MVGHKVCFLFLIKNNIRRGGTILIRNLILNCIKLKINLGYLKILLLKNIQWSQMIYIYLGNILSHGLLNYFVIVTNSACYLLLQWQRKWSPPPQKNWEKSNLDLILFTINKIKFVLRRCKHFYLIFKKCLNKFQAEKFGHLLILRKKK